MSNPTRNDNQTSQDHPLRKFISSIVSIHYSLFQRRCLLVEDNRKALQGQVTGPKIVAQTEKHPVGSFPVRNTIALSHVTLSHTSPDAEIF